jgi:alpha-D-ribose 1-methylphosphonate 5-triphosphate synthase subunit PhnH
MQPAYADLVLDSQRTFRAVLDAVAHPGRVVTAGATLTAPPPLAAAAAAAALTLFDFETAVWVDSTIGSDAREWLAFHTGAPLVEEPAKAGFALVADIDRLPALEAFDRGTDECPERSATLVLQVRSLEPGAGHRLTGPGIAEDTWLDVPGLPDTFWSALRDNGALFPRGVDVLLVAGTQLVALPRTTRVEG